MNKTAIVMWMDEFNLESYKLCQLEYNLKVLKATPYDKGLELVVYGPADNVDEFINDVDDGCVRPLEQMSRACDTDEDYIDMLNRRIAEFESFEAGSL